MQEDAKTPIDVNAELDRLREALGSPRGWLPEATIAITRGTYVGVAIGVGREVKVDARASTFEEAFRQASAVALFEIEKRKAADAWEAAYEKRTGLRDGWVNLGGTWVKDTTMQAEWSEQTVGVPA
jgi:hypothetical protein